MSKLRIEVARLDERIKASDKALELSRSQVSRATLISIVTFVISLIAILITWLKH